jgi:hypothetical protein
MKTIFITLLLSFSYQLSQAADITCLRIIDGTTDVMYPPGSEIILQDIEGNNVLTYAELETLGEYNITQPLTLYVIVTYKEEHDVYKLSTGTLYAQKQTYTKRSYPSTKQSDSKKRKTSYGNSYGNIEAKEYKYDREHFTKGLEIRETWFLSNDGVNYNVGIEFNNGVVFYNRDGIAEAWQNGKMLKIENKYLISTDDGLIKLSYNPKNGEIWYVFEPKEE